MPYGPAISLFPRSSDYVGKILRATVELACEQAPGEPELSHPNCFARWILLFRARRIFFPSSPGACSQATVEHTVIWVKMIPVIPELTESRHLIAYPFSWRPRLSILPGSSFTTLKKNKTKQNKTKKSFLLLKMQNYKFWFSFASLYQMKIPSLLWRTLHLYAFYSIDFVCSFVCFTYVIVLMYVIELNHYKARNWPPAWP